MKPDGKDSKVNIFVASSGELKQEREALISIAHSVNKLFSHLKVDVLLWETDLESGNYQKKNIQEEINPLLGNSQIVIVIFYSKLGKFTLEEYNLAIKKDKKVFLYFKKGFSSQKSSEIETYKKVTEFRERVEKENKALFKDYESIDQFKLSIDKDLELYLKKVYPPPETGVPKYLTDKPARNVDLVGREAELAEMTRLLEKSHRVLLVNGLGGVGKTELCKRYFWDHTNNYHHLAWVDVVGNIRESFVNAFKPETVGCCDEDTVDERFEKIMAMLDHLDKHCLLVADNIENAHDADLDRLRALPVKVIANSRLNLEGFETHTLDFLSPGKCKELFYHHYTGKQDDVYVEKMVERCGRHTLSVELLAKTADNAAMPIKDLYDTLEKKGFNLNDVIGDKVHTFWHNQKDKKRFFNHLLKIFDLSEVTEEEQHILANLSVLPPVYIPMADVREWLKLESHEAVNALVFKGWLRKQKEGFGIFMHQVIQEVIWYSTSPDAAKCKNLIHSLKWKLYLKTTENPIDKKKYIIFAETLLQHIDEKNEELAILANNLAVIYRNMGNLEKALEFQLKALNIREKVLGKNHPQIAQSYNNVSLIYRDLDQPGKALEFQLKATKIWEKVLDENHPPLATSYNNLSLIYHDLGQSKKALEFQLKALNLREQELDKNHPDLASSYNNLSSIYKVLSQPEKALEFQLKALNIREQELDKNHPDLANSYNNLAMIYQELKDYESAALFGEKAVTILQNLFPNGHPNLDRCKRNLEGIREKREAEKLRSGEAKKKRKEEGKKKI